MEQLSILERLAGIPGVSGWEDDVRAEIISLIDGHCEHEVDALGNLLVRKRGAERPQKTVLFSAHMDEVGLLVTMIEESGLLRFSPVGGIDERTVNGKAVQIGTGRIPGVIGAKPVHLQEAGEADKPIPPDKLYIDIGAKNKAEAEALVCPGDRVVFRADCERFGEGLLIGRALDDRAGCALLVDMIRSELPYDCMFSFTVQEETGCTGAVAVGYSMQPDIAVAVETTTASDLPGTPPDKIVCKLGDGPVVSFMDRGTVYDHALYELALETAERLSIPCQPKRGVFGGNESRSLQTAGAGCRVLAVSLPCRYLHTPSNVLALKDFEHTGMLLRAFLEAAAVL